MSDLFKKKQTTTTNESTSGTSNTNLAKRTLPVVPDWVLAPFQSATGAASGLSGLDPSKLAPGADPLQTQAAAGAAGLGSMDDIIGNAAGRVAGLSGSPWNFDAAGDETKYIMGANAPRTEAVRAKGFIGDYVDPGLDALVNTTLKDFDFNAGQTRAQQDLDLAGSGAFGGSGAALTKSSTEDALARARATTDAGLRSQVYAQALGAAEDDANRRQGSNDLNAQLYGQQMDRSAAMARQLADLSTSSDANQRANAGSAADLASAYDSNKRADVTTQAGIGEALRQILGEQGQAPYQQQDAIASILSKLGLGQFMGDDTTGTTDTSTSGTSAGTTKQTQEGSVMDKIGQVAQIAALFVSDADLKKNVVEIGRLADGLPVYEFDYIEPERWGHGRQVGVMAQEALRFRPEAVHRHPEGHLMVDYGAILRGSL